MKNPALRSAVAVAAAGLLLLAAWLTPIPISARSTVTGPVTSKPSAAEPVTLRLLETVAIRSGRLASSAFCVVTVRSTGKPLAGSRRIVPVAETTPLRAVWKLSFWSCSASPWSASVAAPPVRRRPLAGR